MTSQYPASAKALEIFNQCSHLRKIKVLTEEGIIKEKGVTRYLDTLAGYSIIVNANHVVYIKLVDQSWSCFATQEELDIFLDNELIKSRNFNLGLVRK
jgi:hypothetical protein